MKTLGILGGLGPQTTSKIYLSVIDLIREKDKTNYPPIVIYNLPFPFIIEHEAIIQGINAHKMIPYLIDGAKILEKSEVDFAILPCNTLHTFIGKIREAVPFPFLSILEETALALKEKRAKKVGILATQSTIESHIYEHALKDNEIDILYPSEDEQHTINNIIIELLHGTQNNVQKKKLEGVCNNLHKQGAESILLACTDLQLIASDIKSPAPIIDTTEILIHASVREIIWQPVPHPIHWSGQLS